MCTGNEKSETGKLISLQQENPINIRYVGNCLILNQLDHTALDYGTIVIPETHPIAKVLISNWDQF